MIGDFVEEVLTGETNNLATLVASMFTASDPVTVNGVTVTSSYDATTGARVTLSVASGTDLANVGTITVGSDTVKIAAGSNVTITLAPAEDDETDKSSTFTAATYTVSGDLVIVTASNTHPFDAVSLDEIAQEILAQA